MPQLPQEVWVAGGIVVMLLLSGVVGRVWKPMRRAIAAVDVVTGRPARYPGDKEERPGLAERLDRIDDAVNGIKTDVQNVTTEVAAMRTEVDGMKTHVQSLEMECPS